MIGLILVQSSYCSDCDNSVYSFTVFDLLSFCFEADQMSEILKVEEQEVIPKVKERQTLKSDNTDGQTASALMFSLYLSCHIKQTLQLLTMYSLLVSCNNSDVTQPDFLKPGQQDLSGFP